MDKKFRIKLDNKGYVVFAKDQASAIQKFRDANVQNTEALLQSGIDFINKVDQGANKTARLTLETPFRASTYVRLTTNQPEQAKLVVNLIYEPDSEISGWYIIESFFEFEDNKRAKISLRQSDNKGGAIQALKESVSRARHSIKDKSVFSEETLKLVQEGIEKTWENSEKRLAQVHDARTKRYGDLKDGDRILFNGNKGTVKNVHVVGTVEQGKPFAGERIIRFDVWFDKGEDLAKYGQYQGGTYGGVESLNVQLLDSDEELEQVKDSISMSVGNMQELKKYTYYYDYDFQSVLEAFESRINKGMSENAAVKDIIKRMEEDKSLKDGYSDMLAVRGMCIKNNFYTRGTTSEYSRMLQAVNDGTWTFEQIADDISKHSEWDWDLSKKVWDELKKVLKNYKPVKDAAIRDGLASWLQYWKPLGVEFREVPSDRSHGICYEITYHKQTTGEQLLSALKQEGYEIVNRTPFRVVVFANDSKTVKDARWELGNRVRYNGEWYYVINHLKGEWVLENESDKSQIRVADSYVRDADDFETRFSGRKFRGSGEFLDEVKAVYGNYKWSNNSNGSMNIFIDGKKYLVTFEFQFNADPKEKMRVKSVQVQDDRLSPMTYKKLKEYGYNSNDWEDWTQEHANEVVEKHEKEGSSKAQSSKPLNSGEVKYKSSKSIAEHIEKTLGENLKKGPDADGYIGDPQELIERINEQHPELDVKYVTNGDLDEDSYNDWRKEMERNGYAVEEINPNKYGSQEADADHWDFSKCALAIKEKSGFNELSEEATKEERGRWLDLLRKEFNSGLTEKEKAELDRLTAKVKPPKTEKQLKIEFKLKELNNEAETLKAELKSSNLYYWSRKQINKKQERLNQLREEIHKYEAMMNDKN